VSAFDRRGGAVAPLTAALAFAATLLAVHPAIAQEASSAETARPSADSVEETGGEPETALEAYDPLFDDLDDEYAGFETGFPDPLEAINRKTLAFNGLVDRWILDPITRTYGWIMPAPLKESVRNFFDNIGSVSVFGNQLLQLEIRRAGLTLSRMLVNTTVGAIGLLDPATEFGIEPTHADFGQTLAKLGAGSGPYLIIPAIGPTNLRDGVGSITDTLLHPMTYFIGLATAQRLTYGSGVGLSTREANYEALQALNESSVDYYAALRNAYYQARIAEIWDGGPPPEPRRRICDSTRTRLRRQPWRTPIPCRNRD
jgi:phospholipid-binding lipoprotein MlaA